MNQGKNKSIAFTMNKQTINLIKKIYKKNSYDYENENQSLVILHTGRFY